MFASLEEKETHGVEEEEKKENPDAKVLIDIVRVVRYGVSRFCRFVRSISNLVVSGQLSTKDNLLPISIVPEGFLSHGNCSFERVKGYM
jgi:hypothetical protein